MKEKCRREGGREGRGREREEGGGGGEGAGRKGGRFPAELGYSEHFLWPN